mgnify:CR=1 FL=1
MLNLFDVATEQNPYMIEMTRDDMLIDGCFFQECNTCYIPIFYHELEIRSSGTMEAINTVLLGSHFMRRNTIIFDN